MTDETPASSAQESDDASTSEENSAEGSIPPKKPKTWLWIVFTIAAVALIAVAYGASQSGGEGLFLLFRGNATVPQLVGLSQQDAGSAIATAGLSVGQVSEEPTLAVQPGVVVAQSPTASTKVDKGSSVDMSVSAVPTVDVPNVTGKTLADASATLAEEGLLVGTVSYVYDSKTKAGYVESQQPEEGTETHIGAAVGLTVSKGPQTGQVPNVIGLSESDAKSALEGAGFKVTTTRATNADVPKGDVVSQSPAAGTVVAAGSSVTITVASGPPPAQNPTVPNVVGMSESTARSTLESAGFKVTTMNASNAEVPSGDVASQSPAAGSTAAKGSSVTISVSTGPPAAQRPTVPNVVGLPESDAKATLEGAGFKASTKKTSSASVPAGDVVSQSPSAGTAADAGSTVAITVSTGPADTGKVSVPNVVGMRVLEAVRTLVGARLKFSIKFATTTGDFLKVVSQNPAASTQVDAGTSVELRIGLPGFLLGDGGGLPSQPTTETPSATPLPSELSTTTSSSVTTP